MHYLILSFTTETLSSKPTLPNILMSTTDKDDAIKWQQIFQENRHKEKIILISVDVENYKIPTQE